MTVDSTPLATNHSAMASDGWTPPSCRAYSPSVIPTGPAPLAELSSRKACGSRKGAVGSHSSSQERRARARQAGSRSSARFAASPSALTTSCQAWSPDWAKSSECSMLATVVMGTWA